MNSVTTHKPFTTPFLSDYIFTPSIIKISDHYISTFDHQLAEYEQVFLNPDIERSLISKNELLASFAISKAENSQLTLKEAQDVYALLVADPSYDFIGSKLKTKKKLTQKDHDTLEFFNIVKTFKKFNQHIYPLRTLTPSLVLTIHAELTKGMDIFKKYIPDFTVYNSGMWRDTDSIRVGEFVPAPYTHIESGVSELIHWLQRHPTPTGIAVFHTALYALHPFNNGNKRICRILEHILLRSIGLNAQNLYSTSYYYHTEKIRYYKYLLYSLEHTNLNHFVSFMLESLMYSIVSVLKTSIEVRRSAYIESQSIDTSIKTLIKPLMKKSELQFKQFTRYTRGKMARQTLVTYLRRAVEAGIIEKRVSGRNTYYRLSISIPEEKTLAEWVALAHQKASYLPEDFILIPR